MIVWGVRTYDSDAEEEGGSIERTYFRTRSEARAFMHQFFSERASDESLTEAKLIRHEVSPKRHLRTLIAALNRKGWCQTMTVLETWETSHGSPLMVHDGDWKKPFPAVTAP